MTRRNEKQGQPSPLASLSEGEWKRCKKCGIVKSLAEFSRHSQNKDGLRASCKVCEANATRTYRQANPEKVRATNRRYRQAHPEIYKKSHQRYYQEHSAKVRESVQRYQQANPEKVRDKGRRHYWANREIYRANKRCHYRANREMYFESGRRRRARKKGAEGHYTAQDARQQYETQGGLCFWCSASLDGKYHVDHVIPLSRGGTNWPTNLICACKRCNSSKHDKIPYLEWEPPCALLPGHREEFLREYKTNDIQTERESGE